MKWSPQTSRRPYRIALAAAALLPALAIAASAQVWVERGDAGGFPDRIAQRTLDPAPLAAIGGSTDPATGDARDGFCVRIPEPAVFVATTDPLLASGASADLGLRLSLFDSRGERVLADGGRDPRHRTLAPALEPETIGPPGEYVLVVAGLDEGAGDYVVALEGAEGCGDLDIVLAIDDNNKLDRYCLGVTGRADDFHCHGVSGDEIAAYDVELGDFDADGSLDAVFATSADVYANRICPGDDVGRFSFSGCLPFGPTGTRGRAIAVGDLNGDGDLDVVIANQNSDAIACLGDGAFGFACAEVGAGVGQGRGVALGHLDADGNLDAVFGYQDPPQRVCLGDGAGSFACGDIPDAEAARDIALGDFDEDGSLDVVLTGQSDDRICLGDGAGSFSTCTNIHPDLSSGTSLAVGFLDGDTHLDLALARAPISEGRTCLGDGAGNFTCSTFDDPGFTNDLTEIALADFDNDGVLDAALSSSFGDDFLCFGDGLGSFGDCVPFASHNYEAQALAVGGLAPASVGWDGFETGDLRAWATPDL